MVHHATFCCHELNFGGTFDAVFTLHLNKERIPLHFPAPRCFSLAQNHFSHQNFQFVIHFNTFCVRDNHFSVFASLSFVYFTLIGCYRHIVYSSF